MELNKLNDEAFSFLQNIGLVCLGEKSLHFPLKAVEFRL